MNVTMLSQRILLIDGNSVKKIGNFPNIHINGYRVGDANRKWCTP